MLILQVFIVGTFATLRYDPADDLVRIGDVAGLAMDTVRWCQLKFGFPLAIGIVHHLVHLSRAKMLTRVAVFFGALVVTDVSVSYYQMRWLLFFVLGAGFVNISEFVEGILVVELDRYLLWQTSGVTTVLIKLAHVLVVMLIHPALEQSLAARDQLQHAMSQPGEEATFESSVEVARIEQFIFYPALVELFLVSVKGVARKVVFLETVENRFSGHNS